MQIMIKTLIKIVLLVMIGVACKSSGNKPVNDTLAQIDFKKTAFDFGVIRTDYEGKCEFEFQNTSQVPLIINDVKTSCGCTSPEWPEHPVMPGKKGIIKVKFNAGGKGVKVKSISVYSNAKNSPFMLFIRAEVKSEIKTE